MSGIEWKAPPVNVVGRRSEFADVIPELIKRPNEWARIKVYEKRSTANQAAIRVRESLGPWKGHRWNSTTASDEDGIGLYVRYLGPVEVSA